MATVLGSEPGNGVVAPPRGFVPLWTTGVLARPGASAENSICYLCDHWRHFPCRIPGLAQPCGLVGFVPQRGPVARRSTREPPPQPSPGRCATAAMPAAGGPVGRGVASAGLRNEANKPAWLPHRVASFRDREDQEVGKRVASLAGRPPGWVCSVISPPMPVTSRCWAHRRSGHTGPLTSVRIGDRCRIGIRDSCGLEEAPLPVHPAAPSTRVEA
jgi:hypothetical protein